jgi:hypothetical protein
MSWPAQRCTTFRLLTTVLLLTRTEQATDVSRYYLTFADCRLACSQSVSRLLAAGRTTTRQLRCHQAATPLQIGIDHFDL